MIELVEAHTMFDFGTAIKNLKQGAKVARIGWNNRYITISQDMKCLLMITSGGIGNGRWIPVTVDMLAEDWVIVP